jgi:hypothetical protein
MMMPKGVLNGLMWLYCHDFFVATAEALLLYGTNCVIHEHVIPVMKHSQRQFSEVFSGVQPHQDVKVFLCFLNELQFIYCVTK